jgi:hypothetical protein
VADLLECLIQLKALGHSIDRLERFAAVVPAAVRPKADAILDRLLEAEQAYAEALGGRGLVRPTATAVTRVATFAAARRATFDRLQGYSAEQLGRPVDWPGRPATSVADLVAIMLAHDTELIGELRRLARAS